MRLPLQRRTAGQFSERLPRIFGTLHRMQDQIRNIASMLVDKHGLQAPSVAQLKALRFRQEGDEERALTWEDVARFAEECLTSLD
jgi:hypothetical protein